MKCLDPGHRLDAARQHAAFALFVEAATHGAQMAAAGRLPPVDLAVTLAPASSSTAAASVLPSAAAHISAVWPRYGSTASTLAPRCISSRTASGRPESAAVISIVCPS